MTQFTLVEAEPAACQQVSSSACIRFRTRPLANARPGSSNAFARPEARYHAFEPAASQRLSSYALGRDRRAQGRRMRSLTLRQATMHPETRPPVPI